MCAVCKFSFWLLINVVLFCSRRILAGMIAKSFVFTARKMLPVFNEAHFHAEHTKGHSIPFFL